VFDSNGKTEDAAVLVPLYKGSQGDLRVVIVRRTEGGVHGGQLAFPGGKRAPQDGSLLDTAVREASEETGLSPAAVEVLGELPAVDTVVSGFLIHPYLARITPPAAWIREKREIAEILEVPLPDLVRRENHGEEVWQQPDWPRPHRISFYRVGPYKLWGATYRILRPLVPRLTAGEWNF
jgi:8-oxo-dGTP pyrophosphatase MutT (NUDIX family)